MHEKKTLAERVASKVLLDFLLLTAWGLNFHQRQSIRERDREVGIKGNKGGCQFPLPHNCNGDREVHVNHIFPRKYLLSMGIENPDNKPELLLTICSNSHVGDPSLPDRHVEPVHPDIRDAKKNYGKDKKSIEKAIQTQKEKQAERVVFWNDSNRLDQRQIILAVRNSEKMDKKKGNRRKWWPWS